MTTGRGADLLVDPEHLEDKAYADYYLLEMFNKAIDDISYTADGWLNINVSGGIKIVVEPDPDYEPWTISGPGAAFRQSAGRRSGRLARPLRHAGHSD